MNKLVLLAVWAFALACGAPGDNYCRTYRGRDYYTAPDGNCYTMDDRVLRTWMEAEAHCRDSGRNDYLLRADSVAALESLGPWLQSQFEIEPSSDGEGPGAWFYYRREREAPYLSEGYEQTRANKNLFFYYRSSNPLLEALWRTKSGEEPRDQPGDKLDERDERCVALKDVSLDRLDSFACSGNEIKKHYTICRY